MSAMVEYLKSVSFKEQGTVETKEWDRGFEVYGQGSDVRYRIINNLEVPLHIFDRGGNLIQTIQSESNKGSSRTMAPGRRVLIQMATNQPFAQCCSMVLNWQKVMFEPIVIKELGIILATEQNKNLIKNFEELLSDIMFKNVVIRANDQVAEFPPMIAYGNFNVEQFPRMFVGLSETTLTIKTVRCDGFREGCGVVYIEEAKNGKILRHKIDIDMKALAEDEDGVIAFQKEIDGVAYGAKYCIGFDHELVRAFIEKRDDGLVTVTGDRNIPPPAPTFDEAIVEQRIAAETEVIRKSNAELQKENADLREDIESFLKSHGVAKKTTKTLRELLNEAVSPEFQEEYLRQKQEAHEHTKAEKEAQLNRAKSETLKTNIGIVSGAIGIAAIFKNPIMAFCKWIGSFFGAAAAAVA